MLSRDFEQSCDAFDRLNLDQTDCTIDYQMVIRALKARLRITEFPTKEGKELVVPLTLPLFPPALLRLECCSESSDLATPS